MKRMINEYHQDDEGEFVAELACGHNQHVRHRPPFQLRPWVLSQEGRGAHLGTALNCPRCDRAELPRDLRLTRSSQAWNEHTVPPGLLKDHHIASSTWGRIVVHAGWLRFFAATTPGLDEIVDVWRAQPIPPDVQHHVELVGPVRFSIDFLTIDRQHVEPLVQKEISDVQDDEGGDPACWAHLVSDESGTIVDQKDFHLSVSPEDRLGIEVSGDGEVRRGTN
jgi:tellurite methyltransferase